MSLPRYPVYVPTKGRFDQPLTANFLKSEGVPFKLVIEEQEYDSYAEAVGEEHLLVLPFRDKGSVIPARNWIKYHAREEGHKRHWQLDDNIRRIYRWNRGVRIPMESGMAFHLAEEFVERYENIAIAGLNYEMFGCVEAPKPFMLNVRVYSCTLFLNELPHEWRGRYNEDADICLQVLSDGWCTVLFNAWLIDKARTMTMGGGNTRELYQDDGRARMARSLERQWPGVVETKRRFHRPQHVVKDAWKRFDTPLKRRAEVDFDAMDKVDEHGLELAQVTPSKRVAYLKRRLKQKRPQA